MSQITEVAWLPLKPDSKDSDAAAALKKIGPDLRAQPGLDGSWHGATIERPQSAEFVSVWASEEAYKQAQGSSIRAEAGKLMQELIDTSDPAVKPYHNAFTLHKPFDTVVVAPVVQVTSIFLPAGVDRAAFEAAWEAIVSHLRQNPPDGFVAGAHGWGLEEVNGAKVFGAFSGWESVEKNAAGQAGIADKFGEILKFTNVFEVHHTSFKESRQ
ncbi:hypothetical protein B0H66DRAFT_632899 [Apodospora peruviana]|uniref:ABM domain-containing protein n=1 Tax=Apodospora peruviana TaxID=516989 RepID=A0AAE0HSW2_9PEZI|nr:hypothetical protein B0H66DRAFT_632899 [Apodospora peruviana]